MAALAHGVKKKKKNETAKGKKEGGKSFREEFVILLLLQITRNTHADNSACEGFKKKKHAPISQRLSLSVSHPHKHMYAAYRHTHTHTPLISDPLLEWLAHLK